MRISGWSSDVCSSDLKDESELLEKIENLLKRGSEPEAEYRKRMECFFEFRDGGSCERVYQAICSLDDPDHGARPDFDAMEEHAQLAERAGDWNLAEHRWRQLLSQFDTADQTAIRANAQYRLIHALAMQNPSLVRSEEHTSELPSLMRN